MILGFILGLASAFIWATTSLAIKAQSDEINAVSFNAFRMAVGAMFNLVLLPFFSGLAVLTQIPWNAITVLVLSSVIGIAVGDTLYFWGLTKIGAARALPISGTYPLFTWALAVPLLNEQVTPNAMIGTALVLIGIYFLAPRIEAATADVDARAQRLGMIAALVAAVTWAVATTLLKIGLQEGLDVIVANNIRLPSAALSTLFITHSLYGTKAWRGYNRRTLPRLTALAVYSTGIGMIVWTSSVALLGAARAALINTAAPLIGMPLSVLFLQERITLKIAAGTVLAVAGVWLIL